MNNVDRNRITKLYSAIADAPMIPVVMDAVKLAAHSRFESRLHRAVMMAIISIRDPDDTEAGADPEGDLWELEQVVIEERKRRGMA